MPKRRPFCASSPCGTLTTVSLHSRRTAVGKAAVRDGAAPEQGDKSRESAKAHVTEAQDGVKKAQDGDKQRLNGVLDRIHNLISKQTGAASWHPTYFNFFNYVPQMGG